MPSNKDRLYVALHARSGAPKMPGKEDIYHWALLIAPKTERKSSVCLHYEAKERPKTEGTWEWFFAESTRSVGPTDMLLVRIMVAKIIDKTDLVGVLRETPVRQDTPGWNCVGWVKEALERVQANGQMVGRQMLEWEAIRNEAMRYCQMKRDQHRFDGKGSFDIQTVPTFDLIEGREIVV
ncbi:hypothetical protein P170DRAFT_367189 [Aspergillus steynii IBT 23096]|uniref:Uncharacterized protein n=1 Tax=Aspergillus steynii IBT 23096 TaxID=1392250 RepID=A0A2I2FVZ9_9EURO|nr:uncharacterized protein P170DRAFT_367189 [Aspergillus steynii IBT 23096]PLB44812.1 hypothetical protein P170DRAFT_367189 [Aspergillus steynii IBT 23096]